MSDVVDDRDLRRARLFIEKFKFPISPTVLGAIVGPVSETAFMRSMIASEGRLGGIFQGTDLRHIDGRFAAGAEVSAAARDFRYAPACCDRRHSG
jgi:hypothetical protein